MPRRLASSGIAEVLPAARLLGISRNALRYRLTKIGVPDEEDSGQ